MLIHGHTEAQSTNLATPASRPSSGSKKKILAGSGGFEVQAKRLEPPADWAPLAGQQHGESEKTTIADRSEEQFSIEKELDLGGNKLKLTGSLAKTGSDVGKGALSVEGDLKELPAVPLGYGFELVPELKASGALEVEGARDREAEVFVLKGFPKLGVGGGLKLQWGPEKVEALKVYLSQNLAGELSGFEVQLTYDPTGGDLSVALAEAATVVLKGSTEIGAEAKIGKIMTYSKKHTLDEREIAKLDLNMNTGSLALSSSAGMKDTTQTIEELYEGYQELEDYRPILEWLDSIWEFVSAGSFGPTEVAMAAIALVGGDGTLADLLAKVLALGPTDEVYDRVRADVLLLCNGLLGLDLQVPKSEDILAWLADQGVSKATEAYRAVRGIEAAGELKGVGAGRVFSRIDAEEIAHELSAGGHSYQGAEQELEALELEREAMLATEQERVRAEGRSLCEEATPSIQSAGGSGAAVARLWADLEALRMTTVGELDTWHAKWAQRGMRVIQSTRADAPEQKEQLEARMTWLSETSWFAEMLRWYDRTFFFYQSEDGALFGLNDDFVFADQDDSVAG